MKLIFASLVLLVLLSANALQCRDLCAKECPKHTFNKTISQKACHVGCKIDAVHLESPDDADEYCHEQEGGDWWACTEGVRLLTNCTRGCVPKCKVLCKANTFPNKISQASCTAGCAIDNDSLQSPDDSDEYCRELSQSTGTADWWACTEGVRLLTNCTGEGVFPP